MTHPPVDQQITFLYTADLAGTARFYEDVLGLTLARDQGTCRIYHVSGGSYIGICQRVNVVVDTEHRTLIFTLVTQAVDVWYDYLRQRGVAFEKPPEINPRYNIYHCFLRDPNGYLIEIQRFLD